MTLAIVTQRTAALTAGRADYGGVAVDPADLAKICSGSRAANPCVASREGRTQAFLLERFPVLKRAGELGTWLGGAQSALTSAGGCHVPSPAGRMEGGVSFGQ